MLSGGQVLVKSLKEHNVDTVFCVAGESYLPVLDALLDYPDIQVVTCRHESGATFAAESYAHLTGKVGVAMVTRGPGACNGSIGVHTAKQSSAPVLLFVGQINSKDQGKEAFQAFGLPRMFDSHSKWAADIPHADKVADYVARAFHTAQSDRMGPVVLGLPEEVLKEQTDFVDSEVLGVECHKPDADALSAAVDALCAAERPLILLGGNGWSDQAKALLQDFVDLTHMPLTDSFRRQGILSRDDLHYIGDIGLGPNPDLVANIKRADVVLILGARLTESATQDYTLFEEGQTLIHIHSGEEEFHKVYPAQHIIHSHIVPALEALLKAFKSKKAHYGDWTSWVSACRETYERWVEIPQERSHAWHGADMTQIFRHLRDVLPQDAIVTTDAGNFAGWVQRYLPFHPDGKLLAPVSGAMGYGVPSAVAASIARPKKMVVGFCGDGGFMMSVQELSTAMHHGARPIIIVCNNNMYGTIRMHQEKDFPGRVSATDLTNPDFVALAESFGAFAVRVSHEDEFLEAWDEASRSGRLAVIEIQMDPRQISTAAVLDV